jgi:hypothetical protein
MDYFQNWIFYPFLWINQLGNDSWGRKIEPNANATTHNHVLLLSQMLLTSPSERCLVVKVCFFHNVLHIQCYAKYVLHTNLPSMWHMKFISGTCVCDNTAADPHFSVVCYRLTYPFHLFSCTNSVVPGIQGNVRISWSIKRLCGFMEWEDSTSKSVQS